MANASSSENDNETPEAEANAKHEENSAGRTLIETWQTALQNALRAHQARYGQRYKQGAEHYIVQPSRSAWHFYKTHARVIEFFALAIGSIVLLWAWYKAWADPNTIMAVFTIVIAFGTWYGWQAVKEQNVIMLRQMKQTDVVVEAMRIEQKAWLSIEKIQINGLNHERRFPCTIKISNTGETPGKILRRTVRAYPRELGREYEAICNTFDAIGFEEDYEYLVIPGAPVHMTVALDQLASEDIRLIYERVKEFHILCRFEYLDISKGVSEVKGFYTWDMNTNHCWTHPDYCAFP